MAERGAQAELDDLIVSMERTLIAIVQGIALFLLVEGTAEVIDSKAYHFAPFVVSGLLVVVLSWFLSLARIAPLVARARASRV